MPKPVDRLAGRRDAVDDLLRPLLLDADDDDRGDVRIAAGADQRAEMQVEVGAELQPAVGMRDRQRALDVVRDRLAGRVRQVVDRQDDDVVAHADAAVLAAVTPEGLLHGLAFMAVARGFELRAGRLGSPRAGGVDGRGRLPALGLDVVDVRVLAAA